VRIADRFTTGSSIMPQKKNPDVPELARGKTGRVVGHLMGLITLMKGQPLAYNKDNQEDKEPLFDTVDTLKDTLRIFSEMVGGQVNPATGFKEGGITVNAAAMEAAVKKGYATATDLADYLVKKGLPFRDAHEVVAHAVKTAQGLGVDLSELPLETLQKFDSRIEADVFGPLSLQGSLNARNTLGGTAPVQVRAEDRLLFLNRIGQQQVGRVGPHELAGFVDGGVEPGAICAFIQDGGHAFFIAVLAIAVHQGVAVGVHCEQGEADDLFFALCPALPQTRHPHGLAVDAGDAGWHGFAAAPVVFQKCLHGDDAALAFEPGLTCGRGGAHGFIAGHGQLGRPEFGV
jgi:hypothetical protein